MCRKDPDFASSVEEELRLFVEMVMKVHVHVHVCTLSDSQYVLI